ncbi:hypothetical protein HNQ56_001591 [Anaerotaenia torta]|uniref:hypothetical protein n=1 Tax=Anaerotaenia torta TaxID=433293 RepID=UPI003D1E8001
MSDLELALRYSPYIMFDKLEPFAVNGIGCSVFRQSGASRSFRRELYLEPVEAAFVIEYAVYFDYDIQHMYDLEHIWIYVDSDGGICDAEASFHGFYLKSMSLGKEIIKDGTHLQIYCQPGKHAFMPDGNLFRLLPDWYLCCNLLAGSEGLLVMDLFKEHYSTDHHRQKQVEQYIKKKYAFEPTLQFEYRPLDNSLFSTWEALRSLIPVKIKKELSRID